MTNYKPSQPILQEQLGRIYASLAAAALKAPGSGGWLRVWIMAHVLDPEGSGKVERSKLLAMLHKLGVNGRTARRWLQQGLDAGVFIAWHGFIRYRSPVKVAQLLDVERVGRLVTIPVKKLFVRGWRSYLYDCALAGLNAVKRETPISRSALANYTGLARSTQRRHEKRAGVTTTPNLARTDIRPDLVRGLHEFGYSDATLFVKIIDDTPVTLKRLPDTRKPGLAQRGGFGRSKKINNELYGLSNNAGRAFVNVRLYNWKPKAAENSYRRLVRLDQPRATFHSPTPDPAHAGMFWLAYATDILDFMQV